MARRITTGEVGGAIGGINITNTTISAADDLNITIDPQGTGILSVAGNQELTNASELRFGDSDNSHYVGFKSSATVTSNRIWTLPAADGSAGNFIQTDGSGNLSFAAAGFTSSTVTSSFNAVRLGQYFVDTNGGPVTGTLPANPAVGDEIRFFDLRKTFDTFALTLARNGRLIMGDSSDLVVNTESASFTLVYSGNTYGWRILSI